MNRCLVKDGSCVGYSFGLTKAIGCAGLLLGSVAEERNSPGPEFIGGLA